MLLTRVFLQASQHDANEASTTGSSESNDVQPLVQDADSVLSCLKRALKIANAAQQQLAVALKAADTAPAFLYVEILNQYLYYFDQGLPNITSSVMQVSQLQSLHVITACSAVSACSWSCLSSAFEAVAEVCTIRSGTHPPPPPPPPHLHSPVFALFPEMVEDR